MSVEARPLGVTMQENPPVAAGGPGPPTAKCENPCNTQFESDLKALARVIRGTAKITNDPTTGNRLQMGWLHELRRPTFGPR
jgi:hypothetical protein